MERESSLLCPGEEVEYWCYRTGQASNITWIVQCQNNQNLPPIPFSVRNGGRNESLSCSTGDDERVSLDLTFSYSSNETATWSNLSILVLDTNYSIERLKMLVIDCGEDLHHRNIELTGTKKVGQIESRISAQKSLRLIYEVYFCG